MVIATLNAISKLDYPDFEVLVIDNNTKDPDLWHPVEAHCRTLGERFRFFHVDPVSGAKAGALNWLAPRVSSDVEVIAVVDADYIVEPDFLRKWAPLFDDPQVGFVQTTHEYRDWEHSRFLSRFYPGYVTAHKLMFPALTQIEAEFTVGTMCMVRRSALADVGGWAEWCQTEDSELAVRLHAKGYRGYYFADACGRGLIPETLERMRKQRFRWAYGPMQQLRHHWRLYLGIAKDGALTFKQRYFELAHSLEHTPAMVAWLIHLPLWYGAYREIFQGADTTVGADYLVFLAAVIAKRRLSVLTNLQQVGRGTLVDFLLNPVVVTAIKVYEMKGALSAMLGIRWPWQRTDKFPVTGSLRRGLAITRVDMMLCLKCAAVAALLFPYARFYPTNCTALLCLIFALGSVSFMVSIGLCLMHELELKAQHRAMRRTGGATMPGVELPA
jgi:glycosyltransferase involved in cell wall biosynthesis